MTPTAGQVVNGKYRLVSVLGDGGMGTVWKAQHEKLSIPVALKFLHAELNGKQALVDRFLQEARASAQIRSEHVVRTSDVDTTPDGAAFIVLEYLEGQTLQALYESYHQGGKRLSYAEALSFAMQMLNGLEAAHEAGVIHRDLKPDNVMITKNSRGEPVLKLLDFGIAKVKVQGEAELGLTRPGVIMGTPEYMAPEQAYSADGVDGRADVFSLGVIVFEMLAGRRPAGGDEPRVLAQAYLTNQTAKLDEFVPNLAPELAAAVHKAMSGLAKDRFTTARAFREAIEPYAQAARPPSVSNRPPAPAPSGGSDPVMPPVALSTAGGKLDHEVGAATRRDGKGESGSAPAGSGGVAKTLPPEDGDDAPRPDATKAMSPFEAKKAIDERGGGSASRPADGGGTVAAGDMTAMMQPGGDPYAAGGAGGPSSAARSGAAAASPKRKKKGMSVGAVLGIGLGIAALVAGGTLLVLKGPAAQRDDDDRAARNAAAQPAPATVSAQPGQPGADQPAIVTPQQPAQPPAAQPPAQPPPPAPNAKGPHAPGPRGPASPSAAPTVPGVPGVPNVPGVPGVPQLPPGMPNIPGLPNPAGPAPSAAPTAPPPAAPGIPGVPPGLPPMPSTFPGIPGVPPAIPPPGG